MGTARTHFCILSTVAATLVGAAAGAKVHSNAVATAGRSSAPGWRVNIGPARPMISAGHALYVRNECHQDLNVALHYADLDGNWTSDGWWLYRAGAGSYPVDDNGLPLRSHRALVYLSARRPDGQEAAWHAGERTEAGVGVAMHKAPVVLDTDGDYVVSIGCD
ncbi:MAG: hypothetical protein V4754_20805 [Pseudomonadota bacterium]